MTLDSQWKRAYALQARSDLIVMNYLSLPEAKQVSEGHRLHYLQMACEKLVKAFLANTGLLSGEVQMRHAVIAKHLPAIVNEIFRRQTGHNLKRHLFHRVKSIAREIELLAPSVDDNGRRPDNCEYPWVGQNGNVVVPADQSFGNLDLSRELAGRLIIKTLPLAIESILQ